MPRPFAALLTAAFTLLVGLARPAAASSLVAGDELWQQLPNTIQGSSVNTMAVFQNKLIVCGPFTSIAGHPFNHIASWDGTKWDSLGAGVNGVLCMTVWNGNLVIGGTFTTAGGVAANNVALWDGSAWHAAGGSLYLDAFPPNSGYVNQLMPYGNLLLAIGRFTRTGPSTRITSLTCVAQFDGTSWSRFGNDFIGNPAATMTVWNNEVYAGGNALDNNGPIKYIVHGSGGAWSGLPVQPDNTCTLLGTYAGKLVVGGAMTALGTTAVSRIALWDGATVQPLAGGLSVGATAVLAYGTNLLVAGSYHLVDAPAINFISRWDGAAWHALGSGTDYNAWALMPYGSGVYVAGGFAHAGGAISNYLAIWNGASVVADAGDSPRAAGLALAAPAPDPAQGAATLRYSLPRDGEVSLRVFDVIGRQVSLLASGRQPAGAHTATWSGRDDSGRALPAGVYLVRLESGGQSRTVRVVRVR
jgi:hypothetical protein